MITIQTNCGSIRGNDREHCNEFLGVRYATAERFSYCTQVTSWDGEYDATSFGQVCPQTRAYYEHLEIPERLFYHNEFRKDITFQYGEDCLNLNIYTPKEPGNYPVLLYIHGGGFNSGANSETYLDGAEYAKRGIVLVAITYRVGVLGYFTHKDLQKEYGHDGNLGLDDQFTAIKWVRDNISAFYGDPNNITLIGQSAGAISIQYLCCSQKAQCMFKRVIMMSGGGLFPKFSLPRPVETTHEYWENFMEICGVKTLEELKTYDLQKLFTAIETIKSQRKDNTYNTMPVIDNYYITGPIDQLIQKPLSVGYLLGYTNNDMYAFLMDKINHKYAKKQNAYLYYFDVDAKGTDNNGAFHSSDLRYCFGTLARSHRPYDEKDYAVSKLMMDYFANYAKTGNPNGPDLPEWKKGGSKALHFTINGPCKMAHTNSFKTFWNMVTKGEAK